VFVRLLNQTALHLSRNVDVMNGKLAVYFNCKVVKILCSNFFFLIYIYIYIYPQHAFLRRGSKAVGPMS